ncbi:hypothetical protein [Bradyrhizobium sp.]|jgi:hypothetical protein|uniref:hypothetical protein n=1 Tax=Bradyrhizobium sp. TaxID=376 RepID=UPI002DDD83B9|nr:hypothetical protein [Bradyrhizobium sp.]HEV2159567.1 hypothetical protein [Bradyrhizobium sp.]
MTQMIPGVQRDFSFGEVDVTLKWADDHPARKAGLRQARNTRLLNAGGLRNRSGRRALYPVTNGCTRTDEITIAPGVNYKLSFGNGRLQFITPAGVVVNEFTTQGNGAALPWTTGTLKNVVYAVLNQSVYVTYAGMRPQVYTYDGAAPWTASDYNELVVGSSQKRTPFYRISPKNVYVKPSAALGTITVDFSAPIVVPGMVGTRIRYAGRQILLNSINSATQMNATVIEPLPPSQTLSLSTALGNFAIGDVVQGTVSGALGIVISTSNSQSIQYAYPPSGGSPSVGDTVAGLTSGAAGVVTGITGILNTVLIIALSPGPAFAAAEVIGGSPGWSANITSVSPTTLGVQLLASSGNTRFFATPDNVVGPSGAGNISAVSVGVPQSIGVWDEEVMNDYRGFPASVFVDQFRLGFCNFPAVPGGILWSAINSPTDVYANDASSPDNSIFEIAPDKTQVYYVVPGPEGSEFVFCDRAIYYIPISASNPLKPGSVAFQTLSADGSAQVQPRLAQEAILYANAGQNSMMAIIATGAYLRPFNTKNLAEFHAHLFSSITAIACPSADGTFNERYAYVMNSDGSIVVGKYDATSLAADSVPKVGWVPWSGSAALSWVSAHSANIFFTGTYFGTGIVEVLDDTVYLDGALSVNSLPAAFTPPGGKGPLWWIPSQTVALMDQSTRSMGTYQIDANGFIIPQFKGGEDLTVASLIAGQSWTMAVEPFCPNPPPGAEIGLKMRSVANFAASVINSTGFVFNSLFSGKQTPTSPALGDITAFRRVNAYNQGDDATKPPFLRETVELWSPTGSTYDPRVSIIKDTPGPLIVARLAMEVTA